MKKKIIFFLSLGMAVVSTCRADEIQNLPLDGKELMNSRVNFSKKYLTDYLQIVSQSGHDVVPENIFLNKIENIKKILKKDGLMLDEGSQVLIHEEENYIDIKCFNCVINRVNPNQAHESSKNERSIEF